MKLCMAACTVGVLCLAGCKTKPTTFPLSWRRTIQEGDADSTESVKGQRGVFIVPDGQIKVMPPCKATVVGRSPCNVDLRTADGTMLVIGGPGATPEVGAFIGTLQTGQAYTFPDTFMEYQKRQGERPNKPDESGTDRIQERRQHE